MHLLLNMLVLYFLGPQLEAILGRTRFLSLYLRLGLTGSAAVMLLSDPTSSTLGASGAGFGLMGALLVVALQGRGRHPADPGLVGHQHRVHLRRGPQISWQGHLGGLVGGLLIAALIVYAPKANRTAIQWAGADLGSRDLGRPDRRTGDGARRPASSQRH